MNDAPSASLASPVATEPPPGFWAAPEWSGERYVNVLKNFHEIFKPRSYLEIGVFKGQTLDLARCASIAVDPNFGIGAPVMNNKPECHFYKMSSDEFFRDHDPRAILGCKLEMAFLDGFHWFEFLLRDFINTERHCERNSIIFLHDCLPVDAFAARREFDDAQYKSASKNRDRWAGDVWKAAAIIRKYRPDLRLLSFDAPPTGLVAITCLDPRSTLLADNYFEYVEEFAGKTLEIEREGYFRAMNIVPVAQYKTHVALSARFWL